MPLRARPRAAGGAARRVSSIACGARRCRSSSGSSKRRGCGATDLRGLDDLRPPSRRRVKAELRASEEAHPPFGDYRGAPPSAGGAARRVHRHQRAADADPLDAQGPRGRPRGVGARALALGPATRDEPRERASVRHERGRLALQPRRRGARRAEHPVRPAGRRRAHPRRRSRCGGALQARTCTGCSATSRRRTPTRRAALGLDPARGPEPHDRRRPSVGAVPDGELRPRGAAAARQRVRRARRRAPRRGPRHRRGDRSRAPGGAAGTASAATWSSRCWRRTTSSSATTWRTSCGSNDDAVPVRRDAPPALLRGPRARRRRGRRPRGAADRRRAGALRVPRGLDAVGRVPDRAARRCRAGRCTCAASTVPAGRSRPRSRGRIAERFRDAARRRGTVELVPRGGLPRFAYKAARVVDA